MAVFFLAALFLLLLVIVSKQFDINENVFYLISKNISLSEDSRLCRRYIQQLSPVYCGRICLTNPQCRAFSFGPLQKSSTKPQTVRIACDIFRIMNYISLKNEIDWKVYSTFKPSSFVYNKVNQDEKKPFVSDREYKTYWKVLCGQGVLVGLSREGKLIQSSDFDHIKCVNSDDKSVYKVDENLIVDASETGCSENSAITALISEKSNMRNPIKLECSTVGSNWVVNYFDCLTINRTTREYRGPNDPYKKWNFECPTRGGSIMIAVRLFSDNQLRLKCCTLVRIKP